MFDVLISLLSSPNATTYNKANRKCDKKVQKSRIEQVAWGLSAELQGLRWMTVFFLV